MVSSKQVPLSEAYWFQEGPGVRNWQFTTSGVKLLNVGNITKDGNIDLDKTDKHISLDEAEGKYSHFLVDEGDLVIASSGISFDEDGMLRTRGAFIEKKHLPLCLNTSTIRFKAIEGVSDLNFFKFWLDSFEFRDQVSRLVTGSAQQNFGPSHLKIINISLPPLTEQKRIASLLARADRLRQLRRTAHDLGDALLQSVFLEMFGDPVINPKHFQVELFGNLGDGKYGIVDGPFGSSVDTSVDYITDGEIPVIRSKNIRPLAFDESDLKFMSREKFKTVERSKVSPGDILLVKVGATIGDTCIFPDKYKVAVLSTTGSCRITVNKKLINPIFFLQQLYLLKPHLQRMSSEAVQPFLNMTTVKEIQLLLPPLSLQEEFAGVVARVESLRGRMGESTRQVDGLFESLLAEAFNA